MLIHQTMSRQAHAVCLMKSKLEVVLACTEQNTWGKTGSSLSSNSSEGLVFGGGEGLLQEKLVFRV